jgi:hypothetical protein
MKLCISIILLLAANIVFGQVNYLVYQVKGKAWKTTDKLHKTLKIGQLLNNTESIKVSTKSSVVLICENYSTITLNQNQDYLLSQYEDSCIKNDHSLTADYFKFMWDELSNPDISPETDRRKYMGSNVGAVERGLPDIIIDSSIDTINNYSGNLFIRWKSILAPSRISLAVYDSNKNGQLLFSAPTKNYSISLDTIRKYAVGKTAVYWVIKKDSKEIGERKMIRFWPKEAYDSYCTNLQNSFIPDRESAEWYYMLGFCLEANHFLAEAYQNYKKAMQLNPQEKRYQRTVENIKKAYF